jgi:2-amino-4-hydroxy-6-hydroxymethyldihydropteridine diphosphokinase
MIRTMDASPSLPPWARVRPKRLAHIERVAALLGGWASALALPEVETSRWLRAAWLHDALRDAPAEELVAWAKGAAGPIELLHGPASAERAASEGETDQGVLDAVRFHSVGYPGWDAVGRALYCADFLEPGRSFDRVGRGSLAARFPADPAGVLYEVARRRLAFAIESGWSIPDAMHRFWNSLALAAPGD